MRLLVAECLCGNHFKHKGKVDDDDCDYVCSGKPSAACGGITRVNVYKFDDHPYLEYETELVQPEPYNRLGCFKDTEHKRILDLTAKYESEDMTAEVR